MLSIPWKYLVVPVMFNIPEWNIRAGAKSKFFRISVVVISFVRIVVKVFIQVDFNIKCMNV